MNKYYRDYTGESSANVAESLTFVYRRRHDGQIWCSGREGRRKGTNEGGKKGGRCCLQAGCTSMPM